MRDGGRTARVLERLRRRTTAGRYLPEIDGLRFIAISMVLAFHSQVRLFEAVGNPVGTEPTEGGVLTAVFGQGRYGVHLFFVISGFVLALPFAMHYVAGGRRVDLRRYLLRRVTRIEPPYLVALTLFFVLAVTAAVWPFWSAYSPASLFRSYVAGLWYGHDLAIGGHNPVLPPSWSLEIEVQFYVLVPLLAMVFRITDVVVRRLSMVALGSIAAVIQVFALIRLGFLPATVFVYLPYFMAGFLVADLYVSRRGSIAAGRRWDACALAAALLVVATWPLASSLADPEVAVVTRAFALPVLLGGIVWAAFRGATARRFLSNRWIAVIGGMCYSIYLLHTPLMGILIPYTRWVGGGGYTPVNIALQFAILGVVAVGSGAVFYVLVERPCMEPDWPIVLGRRVRSLASSIRTGLLRRTAAPLVDAGDLTEEVTVP